MAAKYGAPVYLHKHHRLKTRAAELRPFHNVTSESCAATYSWHPPMIPMRPSCPLCFLDVSGGTMLFTSVPMSLSMPLCGVEPKLWLRSKTGGTKTKSEIERSFFHIFHLCCIPPRQTPKNKSQYIKQNNTIVGTD